jgi:stage V sporulation protein R
MISGLLLISFLGVQMSDWSFLDLEKWDNEICAIAKDYGLDWFPIIYEVVDYFEMMGHMAYHGMPSHYRHWSYGKSFERTHQMYNLGMEGLPYELIINANPSIAYLMRENPLYLQILIMAHCVGHSDFFKNNRIFSNTHPNSTIMKFKTARDRVRKYIEDPNIGIEKVEEVLDAAHSIRFQTNRNLRDRTPHAKIKEEMINKINSSNGYVEDSERLNKIPIHADDDILGFIVEHGNHLEEWERDLIEIVRDESHYFIPQIQTKIMNEGWASFWHYKIMHDLKLDSSLHLPFLKSHNQVIRPHIGAINPYHLGFYLFKKIEETSGLDECFLNREIHDDESALRCLIEREDCEKLNLFSYSQKKKGITIDEVSDEDGWKVVKRDLLTNIGINSMPMIFVKDVEEGCLILEHDHDGRDLELDYAEAVVNHILRLWKGGVRFFTIIEDEVWEI